ncbi:MAG TPA: DUF748 domain-containing protein, partial [Epsilonproteobacteria bacterium]|nr:DUF748 domain-containing protein [Campylobacterota bacterium]
IDRYGTASAKGSFNAGSPKRFADINVVFRNIELPSYTPYSGKFVGRAISSGKLSVTLRYRIDKGTMRGDNTLVINKIEMGREIESNSSVSLPLEFAIALLEDSDGIIDIDMPHIQKTYRASPHAPEAFRHTPDKEPRSLWAVPVILRFCTWDRQNRREIYRVCYS